MMKPQPQAEVQEEDECPICHTTLPQSSDGSKSAGEAHIAACIESHSPDCTAATSDPWPESAKEPNKAQVPLREEDECPICHTSLLAKEFDCREAARDAHVVACIESLSSSSTSQPRKQPLADTKPAYFDASNLPRASTKTKDSTSSDKRFSQAGGKLEDAQSQITRPTMQEQEDREVGALRRWFSNLVGGDPQTKEQKMQQTIAKADELMRQRWGMPGSPTFEIIMRYWVSTRMQQHWEYLREQHPRQFKKHLRMGYMEPIPTRWVHTRELAYVYPEGSYWETPAEKRLYYLLNKGVMPDGSAHPPLRPLNIIRDRCTIIKRGNERIARQVHLDAKKLAAYQSRGDVFHIDKQIKSHQYSDQVQNVVYEARTKALHELADGILHGTDHLETMLLIDVSGSMTWNPHTGVYGPDGVVRYHDQPSNIALVEHLVHRVLHHMIPRAQREHPGQKGINTVTFSTQGNYIGQLSAARFRQEWYSKVRLGGGTQVMQGWQVVKNTYFQQQHSRAGHGRFDPVFGWQPTPGMPKLSLLVFLDGEAMDMDEFELELLGETWAYVTIALVGMENCPHHHSHAIELERVARFNPHVGFYDVHGRVCERLVIEDLLGSVYPVDPPKYGEILKPEYDLPADELPAYSEF